MSSESKTILETADLLLQRVQEIKINANILLQDIQDMMQTINELNQIMEQNKDAKDTKDTKDIQVENT